MAEWLEVLPRVRQVVGERNFETWIEPIHCVKDENGFVLQVSSRFFLEWVARHFLPVIRQARQNQAQHLRSKIGAVNLLAYQESGEADNFLQMPETSISGPADPTVAGAETKCRRSESQCTQPAMRAANKISHLGAD